MVISSIIARAESLHFNFPHPVRLLLLDHATPDVMTELLKDPRWGLRGKSGEGLSALEDRVFFQNAPLKLEVPDKDDTFLKKIICAVVYREEENPFAHIDDPDIQSGLEYFNKAESKTKGMVRQPLFAALVGDAIKNSKNDGEDKEAYKKLNRRALIKHYLQGKTRLTWQMEDRDRGVWAACFIAAATARRGAEFNLLRQAVPEAHRPVIDRNYGKFKALCRNVVSGNAENTLNAFEPDILGETHFLLFLKEIENNLPDFEEQLSALVTANSDDHADKSGSEFIAFITRLARNLCNDDQGGEDTRAYWRLIGQFLIPKKLGLTHSFKWAASTACFEIYRILKDKEQAVQAETFLDRINANDLYHPPKAQIKAYSVWSAIQYFGLQEKEGELVPPPLMELLALWEGRQSRDYTALMLSLVAKNSTIARYLINQGVDLNATSENEQWTALMFACRYGQEAVAMELMKKNANLEAQDSEDWTALMYACRCGQEAVAMELVKKNANLEAQDSEDWTALMYACRYDQEAVAMELVKKDVDLEVQNGDHWTALMIACGYGQEAVAMELVKKDANLEAKDSKHWTALMFACRHDQETVAMELVKKDANLTAQNNEKWTALMFACRCGQEAVAMELVKKDANLGAQNSECSTALMFACCHDQEAVAMELVKKDANLTAENSVHWTALMYACCYDQEAVAMELVKKDANLEAQSSAGWTALMIACHYGQEMVAMELVKKDANLEAKDSEQRTALMIACHCGQEMVAIELVKKDANLEAKDSEQRTALMIACHLGQETVALELIKADVEVDCKDKRGNTILMRAICTNLKNVVKALLDREVNTNVVWEGETFKCTALELARALENYEMIEMLEAKGCA